MDIDYTVAALMFPAIPLMMTMYSNRFHTLSALIRQLHDKFTFDIWGDTVNTAALMEQNSIPGRVNISESTYLRVKSEYKFEERGEIVTTKKGPLKMFFIVASESS